MVAQLTRAILTTLLLTSLVCMTGYHFAMFGLWLSAQSVVEALNYGSQTVTTVGYGNWVPADMDQTKPEIQHRIYIVKIISIPFTLVGGGLFAVIVGIVANLISPAGLVGSRQGNGG